MSDTNDRNNDIYARWMMGETQAAIARDYGLSSVTVFGVIQDRIRLMNRLHEKHTPGTVLNRWHLEKLAEQNRVCFGPLDNVTVHDLHSRGYFGRRTAWNIGSEMSISNALNIIEKKGDLGWGLNTDAKRAAVKRVIDRFIVERAHNFEPPPDIATEIVSAEVDRRIHIQIDGIETHARRLLNLAAELDEDQRKLYERMVRKIRSALVLAKNSKQPK